MALPAADQYRRTMIDVAGRPNLTILKPLGLGVLKRTTWGGKWKLVLRESGRQRLATRENGDQRTPFANRRIRGKQISRLRSVARDNIVYAATQEAAVPDSNDSSAGLVDDDATTTTTGVSDDSSVSPDANGLTDAHHDWVTAFTGIDSRAPVDSGNAQSRGGARASSGARGAPTRDSSATRGDASEGPKVGEPMAADCKTVRGMVDGPPEHMLCSTHGHVVDTKKKIVIADSVADYDAMFNDGREALPDCKPVPGKLPNAPPNYQLCETHGHVLDVSFNPMRIAANTPSMLGRKQVPGGHAPPTPTPPPPAPTPPAPTPPDPPPQPGPTPPNPTPPNLDPVTRIIAAKDLSPLNQVLFEDELISGGLLKDRDKIDRDLKTRKLDEKNMDDVRKRLVAGLQAFNKEGLETLRNSKSIVDEANDGLQEVKIEIDNASARIKALSSLKSADNGETIKKTLDNYDLSMNGLKAVLDVLSGVKEVAKAVAPISGVIAIGAAILEITTSDKIKTTMENAIGKDKTCDQDHDKVMDALSGFRDQEVQAEQTKLQDLRTLWDTRFTHFVTAVDNYLQALKTLPPNPKSKASPDCTQILQSADDITRLSQEMDEFNNQMRSDTTLNSPTREALDPIGTFDARLTKIIQARDNDEKKLVYAAGSKVTLFNLPSDMTREQLEALSPRLARLGSFEKDRADMAARRQLWESTVDSGFGV
jgi:hypothetical protein